jgi:formate dehydrogenase iron-sulfur subunit
MTATAAPAPAPVDVATPLDRWLADQGDLSAVERFAQRHDAGALPAQARYYRDLVPLAAPGPGEQYGFAVDLDACTGCKACVTACHSLNGLDEGETWRSVGLLHGGPGEAPVQQTVTTACHHCVDPACLRGCPVDAYDKDPATGIVRHLDDQCIGCGYCTWTCPYEVPVMSATRGIVRKCDLCADRLAEGEAPACVQGCPNAAIRVEVVDVAAARAAAAGSTLVPDAPPSSITVPTTVYRSARGLAPDLAAAHRTTSVAPGHAHTPLAVMLVLTQLSVGAFVVDLLLRATGEGADAARLLPSNAVVALAAGALAIGASVLHLGRPAYAFRAVLGVRRSWLSREIVAFGAFASAATAYAGAVFVGPGADAPVATVLAAVTALVGAAGVTCSALIYAVTRRHWWRAAVTGPKFALTGAACGAATVLATSLVSAAVLGGSGAVSTAVDIGRTLAVVVMLATAAKLLLEASVLRHRHRGGDERLRGTAVLLTRDLRTASSWRFTLGAGGGLLAPGALLVALAGTPHEPVWSAGLAVVGLMALVAGELVERSQFFTAVTPPRMPGVPS